MVSRQRIAYALHRCNNIWHKPCRDSWRLRLSLCQLACHHAHCPCNRYTQCAHRSCAMCRPLSAASRLGLISRTAETLALQLQVSPCTPAKPNQPAAHKHFALAHAPARYKAHLCFADRLNVCKKPVRYKRSINRSIKSLLREHAVLCAEAQWPLPAGNSGAAVQLRQQHGPRSQQGRCRRRPCN